MKTILLLQAIFFYLILNAQNDISDQVSWGEFTKVNKKFRSPEVIGQDGKDIFMLRFTKRKTFIERYNLNSLRLEKTTLLGLKSPKNKKMSLRSAFMLMDRPVLIAKYYDKRYKTTHYYAQIIDVSTLTPSKTVSLDQVFKTYKLNIDIANNEELVFSMFLQHTETKRKFKDAPVKPVYTAKLYDDDLSLMEEFEIDIPIPGFNTLARQIGNNGRVYILGHELLVTKDQSKLINRKRVVEGDSYVLTIDPGTGDMEQQKIQLGNGRKIEMMGFSILDNGNIQIVGLLGKESGGTDGSFSILYDNNLNEISQSEHIFEDEFITQTWSERAQKKADRKNQRRALQGKEKDTPEFYSYYIDHIVQREDGSSLMLAEQYYVVVTSHTYTDANGNRTTTYTYHYYYNDIIAVSFDENGEYEWKQLIEKRQVSVNDGGYYSSYFIVNSEDKTSIIFNEFVSNLKEKGSSTRKDRKTVIGLKATLSREGELTKEKLFEFPEENRLRIVPKICEDSGDGIIFLYARNKKGHKFGTINLN